MFTPKMGRRSFLQAAGAAALCAAAGHREGAAEGFRIPTGLYPSYVDEKTGATVLTLTPGGSTNSIVYQTHPMWLDGGKYLFFTSDRSGGGMAPHLLELATGTVKPVTLKDAGHNTLSWNTPFLYYVQGDALGMLDLVQSFQGTAEPRLFGKVPDGVRSLSGTISVEADGSTLYLGAIIGDNDRSAIYAVDTKTGDTREVTAFDFKVGHVQANPFTPGLVMFCHETGGDAPQRVWTARVGGDGPAPFYKETYDEWVTHEAWWGPDRIVFTVWPYADRHKGLPHGIATATLADGPQGKMEVLAQYPAWHTHGSPDGKWVMGDDFDRNLWLVHPEKRERRLLTQGHLGKGLKTHPHGSFTPDSRAVLFNSSREGHDTLCCALLPDDWESLPKAD